MYDWVVALSRVKSLEGLQLLDFDVKRIRAHPKALQYYRSIQSQSSQPNTNFSGEYNPGHASVSDAGGTRNPDFAATPGNRSLGDANDLSGLTWNNTDTGVNNNTETESTPGADDGIGMSRPVTVARPEDVEMAEEVPTQEFITVCEHTFTVTAVRKKGGSQDGKWRVQIKGPLVTGAAGFKVIYCEPRLKEVLMGVAAFVRVPTHSLLLSPPTATHTDPNPNSHYNKPHNHVEDIDMDRELALEQEIEIERELLEMSENQGRGGGSAEGPEEGPAVEGPAVELTTPRAGGSVMSVVPVVVSSGSEVSSNSSNPSSSVITLPFIHQVWF